MLGETEPCSQRAISERGRSLRSDELVLGQAGASPRLPNEIGATHDVSLRHGPGARKGSEHRYVTATI